MLVIVSNSSPLFLLFALFSFAFLLVTSRPIIEEKDKTNLDKLFDILNITDDFDEDELIRNVTNEKREEKKPVEKRIDPSTFITLKENDWRDAHEGRMIIWSHESQHHPDYGKTFTDRDRRKAYTYRQSKSSQLMSFCILGSVIGFILYTYFSHVIMMRKLNREREASRLRELVHRSALIMAGSAHQNEYDFSERRHSLINMFKAFKL
ncbi:hypothetical protein GCK72_011645 [Caenorhabditis remanei]|uniref:Uncharacterized protein n=1 Tax=Caenorhabditis remanei TaxID=31234 RepID=A0A6A5H8J3_CAERE|nr:hypothetical protein GCK72_011645 [Caenorhabditis remanei]KAF1763379.1 hypothetical protein GCK72_011645 [Caenorhabditis remanei]